MSESRRTEDERSQLPSGDDLAFLPAIELRDLVLSKKISPVELVTYFLQRIELLNPDLQAYITLATDQVVASAQELETELMKGHIRGPLHGVPVSVKDQLLTRGIRTTGASLLYQDFVPQVDSIAVERLRSAGAMILGKTNSPEFGLSGTTENRLGPPCRNPWNVRYTSGGSSGGAAASVAAGLGPFGVGSDGGGSIRLPASFCGVYGLKPTSGRIPGSRAFGRPAAGAFGSQGPIARTVKDAALLLQVLAGPDARDRKSLQWGQPPDFLASIEERTKLKLAWSADLGYAQVDAEVLQICTASVRHFEQLGWTVEDDELDLGQPFDAWWTISIADWYASYGHFLEADAEKLTDYVRSALQEGSSILGHQYSQALVAVQQTQSQMASFFEKYDVLITPTVAVPPFLLEEYPREIGGIPVSRPFWGFFPHTFPFNMTGQPAASIPCGFTSSGLPVGLQLVGRLGAEATVLQASAAFEGLRPWQEFRPSISKEESRGAPGPGGKGAPK